jgi:predicted 3-demethylubiquinone-9 3-methyltransferase (glyoxalase superfamily)
MQKITPFLWYDGKVEEAMNFYTGIFKNSKIISAMPGPGGSVMSATIELNGQQLVLFNGGPMFKFTEAVSLFVSCDTQEEIDEFWDKLSEGGQKSRCGWLKDKFGLSWQIIPPILGQLLGDKDAAKFQRVMGAMLQMNKLIIADLQKAYEG